MSINPSDNIRNFAILAHIDHGKSTLADRLLEITGTVYPRKMRAQYLDRLESERERGITIKMAPVRMVWRAPHSDGKKENCFILNLIDTPGHADFSYEVSRALAAVEGVVLLVDATQGIQAQTLVNFQLAQSMGLKIIGAVTKIDLQPANLNNVVQSVAELIGVDPQDVQRVSGKTGEGVPQLIGQIIKEIPSPPQSRLVKRINTSASLPSRALIFDSFYDEHKGVIASVRIVNGSFAQESEAGLLAAGIQTKIKEVGYFKPELLPTDLLAEGEIGYLATGIKDPHQLKIGDTIADFSQGTGQSWQSLALPGYQEPQPLVFVSFYPEDSADYDELKKALERLRLNDSALVYEPVRSEVLGRGFQVGFLGRLHFEITAERLAKEFKISTVHSFPTVVYKVDGQEIKNPQDFPDTYKKALEPFVEVEIISPPEYIGAIIKLKTQFRFSEFETKSISGGVVLKADLPLADLISDLDDKLKSLSAGYASLGYKLAGYKESNLEKVEILIASQPATGLTRIFPRRSAEREARQLLKKLKTLLPRRQFAQALQARIRERIVARENIPALRKNVAGYLYGGDRTRKMKLWQKQKRGKVKLKELARKEKIHIPSYVFKELLKK